MLITHKIKLDLQNRNEIAWLEMVQGDANTRQVAISLYSNNAIWIVPEGVSAVIRYRKPDGKGGVYDTLPDGTAAYTISEYTVTITLVPQVLTTTGVTTLALTLLQGQQELNTFQFYIDVHANPHALLEDSGDYYSIAGMITGTDASLSREGMAADAKAVQTALQGKMDRPLNELEGDTCILVGMPNLRYAWMTLEGAGVMPNTVTRLPNPKPILFTGAVNESYDGTDGITIHIPEGNAAGGSMTEEEKALLLALFKNMAYTADISATITRLEALWSSVDEPIVPEEPDEPIDGNILVTDDGNGNVTIAGVSATDDSNGSITVIGAAAIDDDNGNIIVS